MSKTSDNKNSVRRLILNEAGMNHQTTKETLNFSVCSEYFSFDIDSEKDIEPDFDEATFTVPKEWLLDTIMKSEQCLCFFFVIGSSIFNTETIKNN